MLKAAHHLLQCMLCCMAAVDALYTLDELFGLGLDTWHLQLRSVALTTDGSSQLVDECTAVPFYSAVANVM